jgi:inner membrane protein
MAAAHHRPLAMTAALIWLLLGLVLLLLELAGAEFEGLLAGAIAALVVSALRGVLPLPPLLQMGTFVLGTTLLLIALQRWGRRRARGIPAAGSGGQATVISGFSGSSEGRVIWQGQSWAATNLEGDQDLQPGTPLLVMGRDGTHLQVLADAAAPRHRPDRRCGPG